MRNVKGPAPLEIFDRAKFHSPSPSPQRKETRLGGNYPMGFSIIELVISIVVVSVCIIPISLLYQEAMRGSVETSVLTVATALAEGKLEETLMLGFSGVADVSSTAFASPFGDYSYQVNVDYVNASDLETSVEPTVTDYRTVEVQISHNAIGTISLKSLLTN